MSNLKAKPKTLADVSVGDLLKAVAKMCKDLGIPASDGNHYSIYQAVFAEKKKVSPNDPEVKVLLRE